MKGLVDGFLRQIKSGDNFYEHIVALQSPSGNGKSFFLALLYCKIFTDSQQNNPIKYINMLDHIADKNAQQRINTLETYKNKESKTSVVLIDNLDKHTPKYIYEFIHLLHELSGRENFLFVVAYDYNLLLTKLSDYLAGGEEEIERYLQSHIHLDFFLDTQQFAVEKILNLNYIPNESARQSLKDIIISAYDTGALSIKQTAIVISKLEIYIRNNQGAINEIPEVYEAFKLIIMKLLCKKWYVAKYYNRPKEFDCDNESLKGIIEAIEDKIGAYPESIDENIVIKKMEITNVSEA